MILDRCFTAITKRSEALATRPRSTGSARVALAIACATGVAGIAFVDYLTDVRVSLGILYLIPTVLAGVLLGPRMGTVIAAQSAVAWVLADALINGRSDSWLLLVLNGVLRFLPLFVVVLLLADLRRSVERAQRSEQQTREFLAFAAHQLRTPVAGIQATAEALILQGDASPATGERERLLSNLAGEASRVGRLVRSLLRVARLDQGEPQDVRNYDVSDVVQREADRFRHRTTHTIELQIAPTVPDKVEIDALDLTEILSILLENACRHADSLICIDLGMRDRDRVLQMSVLDDGPGLPRGAHDQVFDRFVSLDHQGGSGLGLSIARGLAIKHEGSLIYEDRAFVLRLPVRGTANGQNRL